MKSSFNSEEYINHIGKELIRNFSFAGKATTPGLVGGARENEIRQKLASLLPPFVGIGSGCIIDSYGETSKQMDIVIYEKDHCPVYSISNTPETTYYPCEGVIAVGEVKSKLNNNELEDIFQKTMSVKKLKRHAVKSKSQLTNDETVCYRNYGSVGLIEGTKEQEFNQDKKLTDQIFCFSFCGDIGAKPETLADKFEELLNVNKVSAPNLITILNYGIVLYLNIKKWETRYSPLADADNLFISGKRENNFQFLLRKLTDVCRSHRTVDRNVYSRYISKTNTLDLNGILRPLK